MKTEYKEPCCFCTEINNKKMPEDFIKKSGINNRIIYQSKNFTVLPSISPLNVGHILIIPNSHITNITKLESELINELNDTFCYILSNNTIYKNKEFVFFEHGIFEHGTGCGVDHAHIHLLPVSLSIFNKIITSISKHYSLLNSSFESFFNIKNPSSYLFVGNSLNNVFYSFHNKIPSQFIRKIVAEILGSNVIDWKHLDNWSDFLETYNSSK